MDKNDSIPVTAVAETMSDAGDDVTTERKPKE